jgi:hypothetical protein
MSEQGVFEAAPGAAVEAELACVGRVAPQFGACAGKSRAATAELDMYWGLSPGHV